MKKVLKFSYMVLLSLMAFAISSCTSDYDYKGAPKVANEVYFSNTQESTIQLSKSNSSFDITLHRVSKDGELTVPLTYTADEGSIFTVPSSVTFADGETEAPIKITYNPDNMQYGTYTGGTITIGGEGIDTTYGIGSFTFKAGATEWTDINTNKSMGSYREDLLTTFFGVDNSVSDIKIQQSIVEKGKYRIVNPYESWKDEDGVSYDADNTHYWVINATDPDYVYVETCHTGLDLGYGEVTVTSQVAYNLEGGVSLDVIKEKKPEWFGTLKDGVITMPSKSLLISMANYNNGNFYYANKDGLFAVALPGSVIANYSAEATYKGRFTDGKDNDFAQFSITKSDDVAKLKYALVSASSDLNATVSGIMDGSVKSEELTQSGDVQIAFDATGKYTLVMVLYNNNDEAVGVETLDVSLKSSKDAAETWNDIAAGTMTIGAQSLGSMFFKEDPGVLLGKAVTQEGVLSQSASDPTKFRITPFLDDSTPLEFTVAADGSIVVDTQETGLATQDGKTILVTDLISFVGASSDNGKYLLEKGIYSNYDSTKKLYTFYNTYANSDGGVYAIESDTFEVTSDSEVRSFAKDIAKAKKVAAQRTTKRISAKSHKLYVAKGGELVK